MRIIEILAQVSINEDKLKIPKGQADSSTIAVALEIVFGILGSVAFLMIVLSGLRYTLSRGNSDQIAKAKNSIIYSAVGLVLAVLAFSIVRFVVRNV
jgi:hypothetical protein